MRLRAVVWGLAVPGLAFVAHGQAVTVPAGQRVVLTAEGRGAQIYACQKKDDGTKWVFIAPDADLYVDGLGVGTHVAGPLWTYQDGSSVRGTVVTTVPAGDAKAIPSLLLSGVGAGNGLLRSVTFITRTQTTGGKPGAEVCNEAAVGTVLRVSYTAMYTFYSPAQ